MMPRRFRIAGHLKRFASKVFKILRMQKSPKLLNKVMEEHASHFICVAYQGKHDGK